MKDIRRYFYCALILFSMSLGLSAQKVYDKVKYFYEDGKKVLWYEENGIGIISSAEKTSKRYGFGKEVEVVLIILNRQHESLDVDPSAFLAFTEIKGNRKMLKIYSEKEYEKKAKRYILWWGPDDVGRASVNMSSSTDTRDKNGNYQGTTTTSSTATSLYYTGAGSKAMREASNFVERRYLKRNTLFKDGEQGGLLIVKSPKNEKLTLTVTLAGNTYVFKYDFDE